MEIHYRSVLDFQTHIAVSARLKGTPSSREEIGEKLKAFSNKRWTSQPAAPSAGCIFKNPGRIPAGQLIDELGLKNLSVGSARVSEVHGNFIVNDGGATAEDVLQLIALIQSRARESRQIDLNTEVIVLGEEYRDERQAPSPCRAKRRAFRRARGFASFRSSRCVRLPGTWLLILRSRLAF